MMSGATGTAGAFHAAAASASQHMADFAVARGIERQNRATMAAAIQSAKMRAQARHDAQIAALRAELARLIRA